MERDLVIAYICLLFALNKKNFTAFCHLYLEKNACLEGSGMEIMSYSSLSFFLLSLSYPSPDSKSSQFRFTSTKQQVLN